MDAKGYTIAILTLPNGKSIIRENYVNYGDPNPVKVFGIEYDSWHAEARCMYSLTQNPYYKKLAETEGEINITVLRYNKNGNMTNNSHPCDKCMRMFRVVKDKYFNGKIKINLQYMKDGNMTKEVI